MKPIRNNVVIYFVFIAVFSLTLFNPVFSQEPAPPKIPQPSPEPQPIPIPEPEPIREPFPEESNSEKIQRLTKENAHLKEKNFQLQVQVAELNKIIENLQAITLEQIKVIMQLVQQLREVIFEMPSSFEETL